MQIGLKRLVLRYCPATIFFFAKKIRNQKIPEYLIKDASLFCGNITFQGKCVAFFGFIGQHCI